MRRLGLVGVAAVLLAAGGLSSWIRTPARSSAYAGIHNLAVDSRGNLYTAESDPNNRAQKFVLKGMSAAGR